jgi:hypothetical protein
LERKLDRLLLAAGRLSNETLSSPLSGHSDSIYRKHFLRHSPESALEKNGVDVEGRQIARRRKIAKSERLAGARQLRA